MRQKGARPRGFVSVRCSLALFRGEWKTPGLVCAVRKVHHIMNITLFSASAVYRKGCADTMHVNSCTNLQPHLDSKTLQNDACGNTFQSEHLSQGMVLSRGAVFLCHHLCLSSLQYTSLAQFFFSQGTAGYDGRFLSTVFWGCLVSRACLTFLSLTVQAFRARPSSSGVYGSAGTAV